MTEQEIQWIERFCDKFTPESDGEPIINRLDTLGAKIKDVFLGIEMLKNKAGYQFPQFLKMLICKKHPKYKAIRKPTCDCACCWKIYDELHSNEKEQNVKN